MAAFLERLDELVLVLRHDTRVDRKLFWVDNVWDGPRRTDGAIESHRLRYYRSGCRRITRDHDGANTQIAQFGDELRRVRPWRVTQSD